MLPGVRYCDVMSLGVMLMSHCDATRCELLWVKFAILSVECSKIN